MDSKLEAVVASKDDDDDVVAADSGWDPPLALCKNADTLVRPKRPVADSLAA